MTPGPFGISGIAPLASGLVGFAGLAASIEPAPEDVSPGVLGFLVTLAVVLACIPLFRSMTAKIRGVQFRDTPNGTDPDVPDGAPSPQDSPQAPVQAPPPARP